MPLEFTAQTNWLLKPQSGYPGCRLAREMVVMSGLFLVLETDCIRQPERQLPSLSYNHNTLTTLRTSVRETSVRESPACIMHEVP